MTLLNQKDNKMIQIEDIFPLQDQKSDKYLSIAFNIIYKRQQNVLLYIKQVKNRPSNYIQVRQHHIIPRSYYHQHKLNVDSSKYNIVNVTIYEHAIIHYCYAQYFKSKNNMYMFAAMTKSINYMKHTDLQYILDLPDYNLDKQAYIKLLDEQAKLFSLAQSYTSTKMWESFTDDKKQKRSQKIKNTILNWPDEKRKQHNELATKNSQETRKKWTDEQKKLYSEHMSTIQKNLWNNISEQDYNNFCAAVSNGMNNRSNEQKQQQINNWKQSVKSRTPERSNEIKEHKKQAWKNKSELEKDLIRQSHRDAWANMTDEKKQNRANKVSLTWKTKSIEELDAIRQKKQNTYNSKSLEERKQHSKNISNALNNLSPDKRKEISMKQSQAHKGKIFMSNDTTHDVIVCKKDEQIKYEELGYVRGNHRKRWKINDLLGG